MKPINLAEKLKWIEAYWSPKIIAELNDSYIKLARLKGEFIWHRHEEEDELFLVIKGALTIRLRDGDITLSEGELTVIPRGVEHCPVADEEVEVLLLEPKTTVNTGGQLTDRTVPSEWI
jgi:mannose-6-phosphate isomerase-like protein (cupin superfamily)